MKWGLPPITKILPAALCLLATAGAAQTADATQPQLAGTPAVALYRRLLNPVLQASDVYQLRHVLLDREDLHIVFTDGVIGLTQGVDGHVTGAFFEGEGEILMVPPDRAERISLALFTQSGVLDQKFHTAYLRFFDDKLVEELRNGFRPAENAGEFAGKWREAAQSLARGDSLELLQAMTASAKTASRFLHLRLAGTALGVFDVYCDTNAPEQIRVAQAATGNNAAFYDIWASFPMRSARESPAAFPQSGPFQVSDFRIRTKISPPTDLEAEAELTVVPRQSGQHTLIFELSRYLKVAEAQLNGVPVAFLQNEAVDGSELFRKGNDLIAVLAPAALEPGHPVQLTIRYSGPVMFDAGGDLLYVGARGTWYPSPAPSFSNFDLTFECPADWTLVATGRRVSSTAQDGLQTVHFVSDKPIPHAGFNLGKFTAASASLDHLSIDSYAARNVEQRLAGREAGAGLYPDPAKQVQRIADQAATTVKFLAGELDAFPYSHLEVTQLPGYLSQSWPGLIYLSSMAFLTPEERRGIGLLDPYTEFLLSDLMLAHETAHQWWGDAVDWESYRDQWIVEALANYSALVMLESGHPEGMKTALDRYRNDLLKPVGDGVMDDAGPVTLGQRLTSSRFPNSYDPVLYGRGTWLVHMLRTMLRQAGGGNDALFFKALKGLLAKSPSGKISTRGLQRAFEQVLPPALFYEGRNSLDWFFDSWVNGTSIPEFTLENLRFTPAGSQVKVTGTVEQKYAARDMVTAAPVYAIDKDGRSRFVAFVFVDEPRTEFELHAPAGTRDILLDPQNTVLRR